MNKTFILDTNILVYFFEGNKTAGKLINSVEFSISFITSIELLSIRIENVSQKELVKEFLAGSNIIHSTPAICDIAAHFRLQNSLKIPDALIAATAKYLNVPLITADKQFFKIKEIEIIKFEK